MAIARCVAMSRLIHPSLIPPPSLTLRGLCQWGHGAGAPLEGAVALPPWVATFSLAFTIKLRARHPCGLLRAALLGFRGYGVFCSLPSRKLVGLVSGDPWLGFSPFNWLQAYVVKRRFAFVPPFRFLVAMAHSMEIDNGSGSEFRAQNSPGCLKIVFVDLQQKLVSAWQEEIAKELPSALLEQTSRAISVAACQAHVRDCLQSTQFDCMVSPANSFGLMDGGLDLEISKYYGGVANLVPVVRAALVDEWCGQQNVGTCLLVDAQKLIATASAKNVPRYIAHVPTMRVPKVLHSDDDIAYRCTWALLTAIRKHNMGVVKQGQSSAGHTKISSVLCAGFGTGAGQFPADECARQMVLAVKHFAERTSMSSSEEDDLLGSSGLMTLWDKAEKIEDAVCSCVPEMKSGEHL